VNTPLCLMEFPAHRAMHRAPACGEASTFYGCRIGSSQGTTGGLRGRAPGCGVVVNCASKLIISELERAEVLRVPMVSDLGWV
jgi:hypothetical protein